MAYFNAFCSFKFPETPLEEFVLKNMQTLICWHVFGGQIRRQRKLSETKCQSTLSYTS